MMFLAQLKVNTIRSRADDAMMAMDCKYKTAREDSRTPRQYIPSSVQRQVAVKVKNGRYAHQQKKG
jgi:uncharacterized protein (DUF427 family)